MIFLSYLLFFFWLGSCQNKVVYPEDPTVEQPNNNQELKVINSINNFAFSLYWYLPRIGNVLISPMSLSTALAMVYYGARNETAEEMEKVLGYETAGLEPNDVHIGFQKLLKSTNKENSTYDLETANAVFLQKDYSVLPTYKSEIERLYNATVQEVDFSQEGDIILKMINAWTAWRTHNKIKEILKEPLSGLTRLFLLNAVYFKGTWKTKFDQRITTPDTFYNDGKIPKTVPMMRLKARLSFGVDQNLKASILKLPYVGEDLSMILLLPLERDGLSDVERATNSEILTNITSLLRNETVQVTLPRFKLDDEYELTKELNEMGMKTLFDPNKADVSAISKNNELYVSTIVHKTVLDVNEKGSEAAGVTGVAAGVRIGDPLATYFIADHPFLVFIRDSKTGLIYFMARVNQL